MKWLDDILSKDPDSEPVSKKYGKKINPNNTLQVTLVGVGFLIFIALAGVAGMYIGRGIGILIKWIF